MTQYFLSYLASRVWAFLGSKHRFDNRLLSNSFLECDYIVELSTSPGWSLMMMLLILSMIQSSMWLKLKKSEECSHVFYWAHQRPIYNNFHVYVIILQCKKSETVKYTYWHNTSKWLVSTPETWVFVCTLIIW